MGTISRILRPNTEAQHALLFPIFTSGRAPNDD